MRLVVLAGGSMLSEVLCGQEAVFVGSRDSCRVHLPDEANVAGQHAVIFPEGKDSWVLQQLVADRVIRVNETPVSDRVVLRHGDQIHIADFVVRAYLEHDAAMPSQVRPTGPTTVEQMARFVQAQLPSGAIIKKPEEPLTLTQAHLTRIGTINVRLAPCTMPEELMSIALQTLLETFAAHRAWLGLRRVNYGAMEYVEGGSLTGQSIDLPEIGERIKPRVLDRAQYIVLPHVSPEDRTSVMAGPLLGPDGPLGMVFLDTGDSGRRFDTPDLDYFIVMLNMFACQLDAIFKQISQNRAATIAGEVSVVHAIQARLTPRKLPQWEQLQFGALREPGRERTGDIYDVVKLGNQMAAFMVAHTPAGGAMPSMLIAQAQAVFRSAAMHLDLPHIFMRQLNFMLYDGQDDHALHAFMGVLDPATGELRYSHAGFSGGYVIGGRGDERSLCEPPAPPLSFDKSFAYATITDQLDPGETLALFTPGVTTAKSRKGDVFGQERFLSILCDGFGQLASTMLKEMLSDLRSHTERGSQPEDVTVLLTHRVQAD